MKYKSGKFLFCITVIALLLSGCTGGQKDSGSEELILSSGGTSSDLSNNADLSNTQQVTVPSDTGFDMEENTMKKMTLQIGSSSFTATLENNLAVDAFVKMMSDSPVIIRMSDYSDFEKVGALGTSLPTEDSQTTTHAGDIVLYNGNQIVIFYGSNSWSYTRLGKIDDLSGWEDALGSGDVTVTFSLE